MKHIYENWSHQKRDKWSTCTYASQKKLEKVSNQTHFGLANNSADLLKARVPVLNATRDAGANAEVTANMVDAITAVAFMLIPFNMRMSVSFFR